jgi:hypothetical protein
MSGAERKRHLHIGNREESRDVLDSKSESRKRMK